MNAFYGCSLKKVIVTDLKAWCGIDFIEESCNPLSLAQHLYSDENTEITNLMIPDGVTSIGQYAFMGCKGLTTLTIPNSVTNIANYAFFNCSGLSSVSIGNGMKVIRKESFGSLSKLTSISFGNGVTSINTNIFNDRGEFLNSIYLHALTPPSANGSNNLIYDHCKLYVPNKPGVLEAYQAAYPWKNYKHIEYGDYDD